MSRGWLKRVAEHSLLRSGLPHLSRLRRSGDTIILAYHDIVPNNAHPVGDRSLHLSLDTFAAQLDALGETHDVVALRDVVENTERRGGRPRAVITFDDAYDGAVMHGVPELCARGLPATIFVAPAFLDGGAFWWDLLTPEGAAGLAPRVRNYVLTTHAGRSDRVLSDTTLRPAVLPELPRFARGAREADVLAAATRPGISLASHSWSHPNLAALAPEELEQELIRPLAWLREHAATALPYLSYPYGLSSPQVEVAAAAAGYRAALRIDGGWLALYPDRIFALPRMNVPSGLSAAGFRLRVAGVIS